MPNFHRSVIETIASINTIITMSFWDLESFLAEEQQIEFSFLEDAPGMSFLDATKAIKGTVPADSLLQAPIWLISTLKTYLFKDQQQGEIIHAEVPRFIEKDLKEAYYVSMQEDDRAKLQNINLRQKSPYFFDIYCNIHRILGKEANLITLSTMINILKDLHKSLIIKASNHQEQSKAEVRFHSYTEQERALFKIMRHKMLEYEKWECLKGQ